MLWSHDLTLCPAVTWSQLISTHPLLTTKLLTKPLQAPCRYHPHLSYTNLDITFYTSALGLSRVEVLHALQSKGQAACLIAGLREKTTYRLAPFLSGAGKARDVLQWKATRGATSEVVRQTAGWTRPNLTLATSTSASIRPPPYKGGPPSLCDGGPSSLYGGDGKKSRCNSRWSSGFTQIDPDRWLDVSAWFIS